MLFVNISRIYTISKIELTVIIITIAENGSATPHSNLRDTDSEFVKLSKQGGHEGKGNGDTCEVYGHIESLKLLYDS